MKLSEKEKEKIVKRYTERYQKFGYSPAALGWGKGGRQDVRFGILTSFVDLRKTDSILDVGCGFADLYDHVRSRGFRGRYVGVELVEPLAEEASRRHRDIEIIRGDFLKLKLKGKFDLAVASGVFNARCSSSMYAYIKASLSKMLGCAKLAAADFMSTYVDYRNEVAFHSDPKKIMDVARQLTRRFVMRYDYMPYEFSLFLFRDASIRANNVFQGYAGSGAGR
jgi:SAM-dependent methyltransferase